MITPVSLCPPDKNLCALALALVAGSPAFAINHTTAVQQGGGANWDAPTIWSPNDGLAPHAGDTYEVVAGGGPSRLRNPITGNDVIFGGDSLKLNLATEIRFKAKAVGVNTTLTFNNGGLILNGGLLNTGDDIQFTLAGCISVTANSIIDTIDANNANAPRDQRSYVFTAAFSGSQNLDFNLGRTTNPAFTLAGDNSGFSGDWRLNAGWLKVTNLNGLGFGDVILSSTTISTNTFTSFFDSDVDFVSPASLTLTGSNTVLRLDEQIAFSAVTINGTSLAPGTYTTAQLESMFPSNIADVGSGSTAGGTLTVVPEPAGILLPLLTGMGVIALRRRRS